MTPASTQRSRILVVDDCEPLRYLKSQYLLEAGFQVSQADTGKAAVRSIETERPDLVLLDVNLPDMHGSEVCRDIKNRWTLPVIFTSSVDIPAELHGTADGCLVSLDEEGLLDAVRRALDDRSRPKPQPNERPAGGSPALVRAERSSPPEIAAQTRALQSGLLREVLDNSAAFLVILNRNQEIVFCNRAAMGLAGIVSLPAAVGLRLGEAFHCVHATRSPEGCGTAELCQTCGAMGAVIDGPRPGTASWEWHIIRSVNGVEETCDLLVGASPIEGREGFVVCTLTDFSHQKRRQRIEQIFFHDILNIAGGVKGCVAVLKDELEGGTNPEFADMADQCASELVSELRGQQLLSQAEDGRLSVKRAAVGSLELIQKAAAEFRNYSQSEKRTILVDPLSEDLRMETDPAILSRVLGNMLKNGLVATLPGGAVAIGCQATQDGIEFWVRDPSVIPEAAQLRIFQRSFSMEDGARALGTYSMKLLTERYLGGSVRFESSPLDGTRFVAHFQTASVATPPRQ